MKKTAKIFIKFSFNNTQVVVANIKNSTIFKLSSGIIALKNSQKGSIKAGSLIASALCAQLVSRSYTDYLLFITGFGRSRFSFINSLSKKVRVVAVYQSAKFAFNGCKKKKARRL